MTSEAPLSHKLLVVSHTSDLHELTSTHLKDNYIVDTVSNATEAMELLTHKSYCLMLVEQNLPEIDGLLFCRRVREVRDFSSLPILFIASDLSESIILEAFKMGVRDLITRPFHPEELRGRISVILQSQDEREHAKKSFDSLKLRSERDDLTHVYNRGALRSYALKEIAKARRSQESLTLMMLDIDYFKEINDQYGHQTADDVLHTLADLMVHELRKYDIIGRFGGDEFVILLPHTSIKHSSIVANKLWNSIRSHEFKTRSGTLKITVSMGISTLENPKATLHDEKKQLDQLIANADQALYCAKENGRDQFVVNNRTPVQL